VKGKVCESTRKWFWDYEKGVLTLRGSLNVVSKVVKGGENVVFAFIERMGLCSEEQQKFGESNSKWSGRRGYEVLWKVLKSTIWWKRKHYKVLSSRRKCI
jgi:hypothetical protein